MGILEWLFGEKKKADDYFQKSGENFNDGDLELGIQNLSKAIELDSTNAMYYYNRGTAKKMMLDYKSAIPDFTKAIDLKFESLEMAYFNRAMSKLHTQDLEGSKKDNRKAEELGYDEYQVEQLDEWLDSIEEMGYDEFSKQFD